MRGRYRMGSAWWCGRFRNYGYRLTAPREAIMDVLSTTSEHLSAEDVYLAVHEVLPNVGLATVYRTLELLVEMGLVFKFDFGDGRARYELSESPKGKRHHHHLICTRCNRIIDYTDFIDDEIEFLSRAEKGLSKKFNFLITNHLIQFYGLCEDCRKATGTRNR
jgi:Fur family ferric uptake transcriptional regulator